MLVSRWILTQRECVGMISACADEVRQAYDNWQECVHVDRLKVVQVEG